MRITKKQRITKKINIISFVKFSKKPLNALNVCL